MNLFEKTLNNKKSFVGYITAGQYGLNYTEHAAIALLEGGVDILEVGVPFSDPIADGPVIQSAMENALAQSIRLRDVFQLVRCIKDKHPAPIVLFTYANPLYNIGFETSLKEAAQAGVDGLLVVDLPLEESDHYFQACHNNKIEPICLLSPSTPPQRIKKISSHCNSFLYYVCRNGVTGMKNSLPQDYAAKIATIKKLTNTPVVAGFGIGNKKLAQQAIEHADGFVVGSAFVNAINQGASAADLKKLAKNIDPR